MDSVPYAFGDSVVTLLSDDSAELISNLSSANPQFYMWSAAVSENNFQRQIFAVIYDHDDNGWCYEIKRGDRNFSFEEFKRIDKRHSRVNVRIGGFNGSPLKSSEEEIREIASYTVPLVNLVDFTYIHISGGIGDPLLALPRVYRDCAFSAIFFYNNGSTLHDDFLLPQLRSKWLKRISVRDPSLHKRALKSALKEFKAPASIIGSYGKEKLVLQMPTVCTCLPFLGTLSILSSNVY